mmetsp:Transcript_7225/g.13701  ORF Transcript_7225/g.13701 Transcript_7225/m.13701 type:complete len:220 (-) Transcript_7225:516-1175(-)
MSWDSDITGWSGGCVEGAWIVALTSSAPVLLLPGASLGRPAGTVCPKSAGAVTLRATPVASNGSAPPLKCATLLFPDAARLLRLARWLPEGGPNTFPRFRLFCAAARMSLALPKQIELFAVLLPSAAALSSSFTQFIRWSHAPDSAKTSFACAVFAAASKSIADIDGLTIRPFFLASLIWRCRNACFIKLCFSAGGGLYLCSTVDGPWVRGSQKLTLLK